MRKLVSSLAAVGFAICVAAEPASAESFNGRIRLVQTTGTEGTLRFFITTPSPLSLFATGVAKEMLLQAVAVKAFVSIGYTPIACPGGITPPCGLVTFVTLDTVNF